MKPDRCQATAASGKPCSATPRPGRPYCLWHDPEAARERVELSRKGGQARSTKARAEKTIPEAMTPEELAGWLSLTFKHVLTGRMEPKIGTACAAIARTMLAVREQTELEGRLAALEDQAGRRVR